MAVKSYWFGSSMLTYPFYTTLVCAVAKKGLPVKKYTNKWTSFSRWTKKRVGEKLLLSVELPFVHEMIVRNQ